MIRLLFSCCVLLLTTTAHAAVLLTLTLPSADTYCYWVQSKSGTVTTLPTSISHKKTVTIAAPLAAGDRLIVLDAHTGEVASRTVGRDPHAALLPITLTLTDFQPLPSDPSATPTAPTVKAATAPSPIASGPPEPSAAMRFLTGLLSVILAAGVGWVVWRLVQTRGEPLRKLARQAGVDVPDPKPLDDDAPEAAAPVYELPRRLPQIVPEEAGLPPLPKTVRGPEMTLAGIPALHGLQGLAAGSTFALTAGDVTIGRDGENEIVLAENTVSRRHARILRDSRGQFTVTDLGSANGVYVNGERVQRAILSHGDEVKVGDNYFRFYATESRPEVLKEME